jgi:hypothetical protein
MAIDEVRGCVEDRRHAEVGGGEKRHVYLIESRQA